MEHLARSAGELHNRRTGRGKMHERAEQAKKILTVSSNCSNRRKEEGLTLLWTEDEKRQCLIAARRYGKDNFSDIAKYIGTKTEAQVEAHLPNFIGREKFQLSLLTSKERL